MAIKISNTTVVNDSRELQNIASLDATTITTLKNAGIGGTTFTKKTANYTAVDKDGIIADTTAGAFTVTLPASPTVGMQVQIADGADWGTNNLTVARNGSTIEGAAEDLTLDISGAMVTLIYAGSTWEVFTQVGAGTGTPVTLDGTQTLTNKTLADPILTLGGTSGGAGQVLVSQGEGLAPVWGDAGGDVSQLTRPSNSSPVNGTTGIKPGDSLVATRSYSAYGTPVEHQFQISTSSDFTSGVVSTLWYPTTEDMASYVLKTSEIEESGSYNWRVVSRTTVNGIVYYSDPSAPSSFTTAPSFYDPAVDVDGLSQIITTQQSEWNSSTSYALNAVVIVRKGPLRFIEYKSLVASNLNNNPETSPSQWQLVFDNNGSTAGYFGEVLGSACVVDKGEWNSATAYSIGDMVVVAKVTPPKKQSDLEAYVAKTTNTNKNPATNPADWQQRNGLPTGTSLAQTLGIGNTTPEVLINNDSGWLKFIHKGKIKYVAKKPFMHTVSWDDIAKSEAVYGNRTIRIGSRLYRVSILTGAEADPTTWTVSSTATDNKGAGSEWNELIYRVHAVVPTSGTTTYHGGAQIGSNWHNFNDADMIMTSASGNGSYTWCRETVATNTSYRVLRGYDSLSNVNFTASSHTNTNFGWRPCLTLISEPEADSTLYNAEASGVGPSVASLQYDPITDTGYYGEVTSAQLYTGSGISTAVGISSGTLQNDTEGWLKFYWHGQVLYVAKKTYRHSISWDNINTAAAVYGVNLGSTGRKTVSTGGNTYEVKLMMGAVKDPSPASGGGRQWNELLYRVCTGTETGEIGANWALLSPSTDLGINSGNGSYTWCREVYQPNTSYRVYRGSGSLSTFDSFTSSYTNTGFGWRPCLALVR